MDSFIPSIFTSENLLIYLYIIYLLHIFLLDHISIYLYITSVYRFCTRRLELYFLCDSQGNWKLGRRV